MLLYYFTEALVRQLLPLGFSKTEIRHQLYLSSNNVNDAACRLLDRQREEKGREGEGVGNDEETSEKKFSIGKFEVCVLVGEVLSCM